MKIIICLFILAFTSISENSFAALSSWSQGQAAGMNYDIYRPAKADAKSSSLMINLHGCLQKPDDFKARGNWESAAEFANMTIVLPAVPNGGVILGCWSYYGADHDDQSGDSGAVVALVEQLLKNKELNLDSTRVFVSGLSSGAGEAFVLGCLRPDIFSGVGLNSAPILGSSSGETQSPSESASVTAELCQSLAKGHASEFVHQKASIIYDEADPIVNARHSLLSAQAFEEVYDAYQSTGLDLQSLAGTNRQGTGTIYFDASGTQRLSVIMNNSLGHAWAAGSGSAGGSWGFINGNSVNYPSYLAHFFNDL